MPIYAYSNARSILQVLHARGISDIALSKQTGIHRVTLNRIRNGKESGKTSLPVLNQLIIEKSLTPQERTILYRSSGIETLEGTEKPEKGKSKGKKAETKTEEQSGGFLSRLWSGYRENLEENIRRQRYEENRLENARKLVERADKKERARKTLQEIEQNTQVLPKQTHKKGVVVSDTLDRLASIEKQSPVCVVCKTKLGLQTHASGYQNGKEVHFCLTCANIPKYQQWLSRHSKQ
jgi:DNA-binding Xre family transcriptional regulator